MNTNPAPPKRQVFIKFALLCGAFLSYAAYLSYQYDFLTGGIAALLTWSFFVFCTPLADAGFLLDLPLRLIFGVRMIVSEIAVWVMALGVNLIALTFYADYYQTTLLTKLLYEILTTPYPYWAVILISGAGTFLSVRFGDELMDVVHHRDRAFFHRHGLKHEMIVLAFFILILVGYEQLIASLGIDVGR